MYVLLYPASPSRAVTSALLTAGYHPVPVADMDEASAKEPTTSWSVAVIELAPDPSSAMSMAHKVRDELAIAVLVVVDRTLTADLPEESGFDDFILTPLDTTELRVRLHRLGVRSSDDPDGADPEGTLRFHDLELNTATYQATVAGAPTDLTYMEYELLRFFVEHRDRVWSREQILSKVWGYDYFGGSRTVDVHVRRLRAKLGEERASWITTVRSVGYRFG
ncbi:MAG: response regulator transcription factor [Acidimicrobiia bacterium]|nr:response regulator transcription factor [Acidimicrobiia bacterium]